MRAPYDGIITARFADPGALIQIATSSATTAIPLFTIMDLDDGPDLYQRAARRFTLDHFRKDKGDCEGQGTAWASFTGTITRSTLALDPSTRSLLVEIDLPNPDHVLRPGTFAEVALGLREIPNALGYPPKPS